MNMPITSEKYGPARRGPSGWLMALGAVAFIGLPGCQESRDAPVPAASPGPSAAAEGAEENNEFCGTMISSLREMYRIDRLETTTDLAAGQARLNDWQRACARESIPQEPRLPAAARNLLNDAQWALLTGPSFRLRDASHLRDCMVLRAVAQATADPAFLPIGGSTSDLDRVLRLFDHVVGNVQLMNAHPSDLPFPLYEVCLFGRGTAADRAWLFVCLLRSLRIDAVLLLPEESPAEPGMDEAAFLVGVLLDEVYLFDPALGVPIPHEGSAAGVATLAAAVQSPELLARLSTEATPYALSAQQLRRPRVLLVGDLAYWSSRAAALQPQLAADGIVVSDPLGDADDAPGLWSRVLRAGGEFWGEQQMALWSYPQDQVSRSLALSDDQKRLMAALRLPFRAYLAVVDDPNNPGQKVLAMEERVRDSALRELDKKVRQENQYERVESRATVGRQMHARLQQVAGNLAAAVSEYTDVQSRSRDVVKAVAPFQSDPENRQYLAMHARAIDDASFWIGVCKYRQGEFLVAERTFARYLKQSTERSAWIPSSRYLLAQSLAAQQKYAQAVKVLEEADEDDPQAAGYQVLIRRYGALARTAE